MTNHITTVNPLTLSVSLAVTKAAGMNLGTALEAVCSGTAFVHDT
jgi:hypothetical protein